jgi:hypothetical protein
MSLPVDPTTRNLDVLHRSLGRPQVIFFSELESSGLQQLLAQPGVIEELTAGDHGVALALHQLDAATAQAVQVLNAHAVPVIAWLLLPPGEGVWLNLQNYPQALERYHAFRNWAVEHDLRFVAVGLDIEPPPVPSAAPQGAWNVRTIVRRLWLARENVLYTAARAAYTDLIATIHHDGYEVHTYQLPLLADDRRAGTTLLQRAFDLVDLPADVEVLMCYSSIPIRCLGSDLGGALISSYGPTADAIGIGSVGSVAPRDADTLPPLAWEALERDLLLAAHHTDTIYVSSLEGCVERGLLTRIRTLNWDRDLHAVPSRRVLVTMLRAALLLSLITARFSRSLIAWMGWGFALVLLFRQIRAWRQRRTSNPLV